MNKSEKLLLEAFLYLPVRKLLNHQFELEEDYLAGYVTRFLHGERFKQEFVAFSKEELEVINPVLKKNADSDDGKDLLTAVLLTEIACNILNKYRKY